MSSDKPFGRARGRAFRVRGVPGSAEGLRPPREGTLPSQAGQQQHSQAQPQQGRGRSSYQHQGQPQQRPNSSYQQRQGQQEERPSSSYRQHEERPSSSYQQRQGQHEERPSSSYQQHQGQHAERPGPSYQQSNGDARGRHKQRQQPAQSQSVASSVADATGAFRGLSIGAGDEATRGGTPRRGAMRGKLEVCPIPLITKPQHITAKQGQGGTPIELVSNHFKLRKSTDWSLHQYRVDFSPDEELTRTRKQILRRQKDTFGDVYMFDGSMLFTTRRLPSDVTEILSTRESDDQTKVKITIKRTAELVIGDYQYIQLFNIIVRNCIAGMNFQLVGREYFDPNRKEDLINFKLEIWPGYVTSILQYEHDRMMCIDVSHKVLRKDTVHDLYLECKRRYGADWENNFSNAIVGAVVFTHYNNKPYRVDDVSKDLSPRSTFVKGGENITYLKYYKDRYALQIADMNQPLLISRPKDRDIRGGRNQNIVLIPELCNMTGLSNEMRTNLNLMRAVADKTRILPRLRLKAYADFRERLYSNSSARENLQKWNLEFAKNLTKFQARLLPPENIFYTVQKCYENRDQSSDWTSKIKGKGMLHPVPLNNWALIIPKRLMARKGDVDSFLSELRRSGGNLGYTMSDPVKFTLETDSNAGYNVIIEKALSQSRFQLIMAIIPNNSSELYSVIKRKCCIDRPVASQVIAQKTLTHRNLHSVTLKIVVQINCKLGGTPWFTPIPFRCSTTQQEEATMVVGFDVCHDGNARRNRSFGATVASLDYYFTRFYSSVSLHPFGHELSKDIAIHISQAVSEYVVVNKKPPSKIILYRDGVGESNISFVLDHEVKMITKALSERFKVEIGLMVIVVSKRIQTRLFYNNDNPKPGTIVDDVITQPERFDFYLVSQSVRQGTVTPTYYNVIYDTTHLQANHVQRITYKMCHLYYNCSSTVRVPAQVQYAHKLAFLVGQSLQTLPSPELNKTLYFL